MRRFIAWIVTIGACVVFIYTLQVSVLGSAPELRYSASEPAASVRRSTERYFNVPVRLAIPSIDVNAKVQETGLTAKGEMGIPTNFTDVAWYKHGTIPGEVGSAVIDGHVDNALGLPGVFSKLKNVKRGDDIYVTDKNGTKIHFVVREVQEYPYDKAPAEEIFNESERSLLRLITCGGKWIQSAKTYDTRVVVTAEYIP